MQMRKRRPQPRTAGRCGKYGIGWDRGSSAVHALRALQTGGGGNKWLIRTALYVNHVAGQILLEAVLAISAPDTRPPPSSVERLHRLKVFAIYVSFAKLDFITGAH